MRKRLKLKKRSCAMCKPHKMSWENRWKAKDRAQLEVAEKVMREDWNLLHKLGRE